MLTYRGAVSGYPKELHTTSGAACSINPKEMLPSGQKTAVLKTPQGQLKGKTLPSWHRFGASGFEEKSSEKHFTAQIAPPVRAVLKQMLALQFWLW